VAAACCSLEQQRVEPVAILGGKAIHVLLGEIEPLEVEIFR
jgi:hypothetical protein